MPETGSDFLFSYRLDGAGGAVPLDPSRIDDEPGDAWVHIDLGSDAARAWLDGLAGVAPHVRDVLLAGETRPRTFVDKDGLAIVLRGVNTNPGEDPEDMVAVRIWFDGKRLISSRRRRLLSVIDVPSALDEGRGPKNAADVLLMIVERLTDRIGEYIDTIEEQLDEMDDELRSGDPTTHRSGIAKQRRLVALVRRFISPQRDALDRLARFADQFLTPAQMQEVHQETDRITRYLEDLDLARERAIVMHEDLLSRIAEQQNSRMYVLSIVAAIFLPLTFVTGLLGMNVGGLPGLDNPAGFTISVVIMVAAGLAVFLWFRMRKWL